VTAWFKCEASREPSPAPRIPIDRDHLEQARRTEEPGWVEAEPQVLMLPGPVREAVLARTLRPREAKGVAGILACASGETRRRLPSSEHKRGRAAHLGSTGPRGRHHTWPHGTQIIH
jgi:hypothetical protein